MIRELFLNSLYVGSTIIIWMGTLAAVRLLGCYTFRRIEREFIVAGNTVTVGSAERSSKPTLIATATIPASPLASIKGDPGDRYTVQCGSCKTPILSKPVRTELGDGGKARHVYKCEHCGATVGVKA